MGAIPDGVREAAAVVTDWCLSQMGPAKLMTVGETAERHRMLVVLALGLLLDDAHGENRRMARTDVPEVL